MILNLSLAFFLALSLCLNLALFFWAKSQKKKPIQSYEASQLLNDLLSGEALVRVQRVAPSDVLIRSPRNA